MYRIRKHALQLAMTVALATGCSTAVLGGALAAMPHALPALAAPIA